MPGLDRTGPFGMGPMTGRGFGFCGRGIRRGMGRGFAYRRGFGFTEMTKEEEKKLLEQEKKILEEEKKEIEARLKELEKD